MGIKNFIKATRLRTLPLSVSGIIVGSFLGLNDYFNSSDNITGCPGKSTILNSSIFWMAILTTIGFQVLSNFANDYGDGIKGTDKDRKGEARMVALGKITPKQMKKAMIVTTIFTLITTTLLIYVAFGNDNFMYSLLFFGLGVISVIVSIKYTIGKSAYGYSGFGDVFVFLFFGLLAVTGIYFLFTQQINFTIFLPASSVGLLSTAVLNLNNMRDWKNDAKAGKNTIVVKKGIEFAKYYHYYLLVSSLLFASLYVAIHYKNPFQFSFLTAYLPLVKHAVFVYKNKEEALLDRDIKKVALSTFLFALLFGLGNSSL